MSLSEADWLSDLNESQREAVTWIDGPLLILAGPGSGKTRVITHRIAHMIDQGIEGREILGLTFTNKAAAEMRARLERLIGPSDVWLGTFHGFCVRLLRRYARQVGLPENFSIYDMDDAQACLKQAVKAADFELTHTSLAGLAQQISSYKNRLVTPDILMAEAFSSSEYNVAQIYPHYQRALLNHAAVDFDDLLMHTAILLREHSGLREELDRRYRYVLVDEYQDTNLAQYVILRHLCVDYPNLAATGDPDQSIYGWRGASVQNLTHLERDFDNLRVIRLEENYRSTPEILSIADGLIQNNEFRKHKQLVPNRSSGCPVALVVYPTGRAEAEDIAEQIQTLIHDGEYSLRDFGVLYRTNAQSRLIEQAMLRRNLPYQLIGGYRFYLRKEIKDLVSYLALIHNPDDDIALQRIINVPPRGIGKQTVESLQRLAIANRCSLLEACRKVAKEKLLSARATTAVKRFVELMESLLGLTGDSLALLLQNIIQLTGYREHHAKGAQQDGDQFELQQNIDELLYEAHELDRESDSDRPALERFLETVSLQSDADRMQTGSDVVTLMTLHAAKGLEFPCVYLIAVEENILPHSRSREDPMQLEEERRLLFVGITRAKDRLQLSYAKSRGFDSFSGSGVASSFLMELPRHEMSVQDRCEWIANDSDSNDFEFDQYFEAAPADYDEACQLDPELESEDWLADDEGCQLPPEERKSRLLNKARQKSARSLVVGSSLRGSAKAWGQYRPGVLVRHPEWGQGTVIKATGVGPKRTVTVLFEDAGQEKTFRLSHASLTLEG